MAYDGRAFGGTHFLKFSFHMFGYLDFLLLIALLQSFFFFPRLLFGKAGWFSFTITQNFCLPSLSNFGLEGNTKSFFFSFSRSYLLHFFLSVFPGGTSAFFYPFP